MSSPHGGAAPLDYRSAGVDLEAAEASKAMFQERLNTSGYGAITTEITPETPFTYAEDYHQQYLERVPNGYCGLGGTGVSCPIGLTA